MSGACKKEAFRIEEWVMDLKKLRSSINGDYYLGEDKEIEIIETLLKKAGAL